jgi:DNA-binding response OmpR family regulator
VLAAIRAAKPALPVIVLTARGELEERIAGLDAGAVDYLVKPFELGELAARIRAQVRTATNSPMMALRSGDIELDLLTREVRRAGEIVRLSTTEFELLAFLVRHRGQVVSREQIQRAVWSYDHDPGTNSVDVYIGYLRRKLRRPGREAPIVTIRSAGYRLDDAS